MQSKKTIPLFHMIKILLHFPFSYPWHKGLFSILHELPHSNPGACVGGTLAQLPGCNGHMLLGLTQLWECGLAQRKLTLIMLQIGNVPFNVVLLAVQSQKSLL